MGIKLKEICPVPYDPASLFPGAVSANIADGQHSAMLAKDSFSYQRVATTMPVKSIALYLG